MNIWWPGLDVILCGRHRATGLVIKPRMVKQEANRVKMESVRVRVEKMKPPGGGGGKDGGGGGDSSGGLVQTFIALGK